MRSDVIVGLLTGFLFLIIVISSFSHYIFNQGFYYSEFEKHGVYDVVGEDVAHAMTKVLISFFHNKQNLDWVKALRDEEKSHLHDVKNIIGYMYLVYGLSVMGSVLCMLALLKSYKKKKFHYDKTINEILRSARYACMITIGVMFILTIVFLSGGFDFLFLHFHEVFFPMGNWTFPEDYLLVNLFPKEFFLDAGIMIFRRILIVSFVGLGISLWAKR